MRLAACLLAVFFKRAAGDGELRLVNAGSGRYVEGSQETLRVGRVELFHAGLWGSICDHGWGMEEATVVCRQMGYPGALAAVSSVTHGEGAGTGPIWMGRLRCTGPA